MPSQRFLDVGSYVVMGITLVLFVAALFLTGFTHDLLLEAGVFLVSAKLVINGYRSSLSTDALHVELREIRALLEQRSERP